MSDRPTNAALRWHALGMIVLCLALPGSRTAVGYGRMATVRTEHYDVSTDLGAEFARLVGTHMENVLHEYRQRLPGFNCSLSERFHVRVFARRADYERAMPDSLSGSTGSFVSQMKLLATFKEDRTREDVLRTLYHEGFHQFMYRCISRRCPLWLNEGLAEYFAEATWNGRSFDTGQLPPERLKVIQDAIRKNDYMPFRKLLSLKQQGWLRNVHLHKSRASLQYCQAWSAVHFLLHGDGGQHRQKLLGYLRDIASGTTPERAFQKHFGQNLANFEMAWRRYVMALRPDHKHRCERNVRLLMHLALHAYDSPSRFRNLPSFRNVLLYDRRVLWSITSGYGEKFSSENPQEAAQLFRCPLDRSGREISYVLIRDSRTGQPSVYCTRHPGITIRGFYERGGDGSFEVEVEELVTDTLPAGLRQRLGAELRRPASPRNRPPHTRDEPWPRSRS